MRVLQRYNDSEEYELQRKGDGAYWTARSRRILLAICMGFGVAIPCAGQSAYVIFPAIPNASRRGASQPVRHQVISITLVARDSTVAYVVGAITRQAGLRLSYETDNPLFAQRISVHMVKIPVMDALKTALKGKGLAAWLAPDGETIVIRPSNNSSAVRDRVDLTTGVVAGRVTDSASGKGIGGATVLVKGTALRATTVETGQFTIKTIPAGTYTLAVRSFGYKPQTVPVTVTDSERTTVNVALVPTPTVLSGVVTQVSGVQQRREVGADITVLNADSIMATAPVSTVTDLLETRVPGLTVLRQSGLPGAPRRLRLRGTSSIERSNDPILIVDGIRVNADQSGAQSSVGGYYGPSPIDQIDPNTIETIEVFKGPSASAMYGSDAGNGVIVITTKHGQAGRTRWNMRLDDGRSSLPSGGYPDNVFLFAHSIPGRRESISHLCLVGDYNCDVRDSLVRYQALNDPRFNVFGHGLTRQASLSVSGGTGSGTGALTYALTGSASSETGLFQLPAIEADRFLALHGFPAPEWMHHPDQYSTWGGTSRVDLPLSADGGHVALTSSYFQSQQQQGSVQGAIQQLLGRYVDTTQLTTHPLFPNYYTRAQLGTGTVTTGATLHWPVRTWLPLDATAGLNVGTNDNRSVLPSLYSVTQSVFGTFHQDSSGTYNLSQGQTVQQTLNGGTSLIVPAHGGFPGFKLPVGFNWTAQSAHGFSASTGNLLPGVLDPTQFLYGNNSGPTQSRQTTNTYGWYVVPTLDFGHGLYWNPGLRFDGGSASGTNAGFSLLPHLNLAWVAIDQPERPVLGAITLLRPRVAFGVAGVQPDPTSQYRLLTQTTATTPDGVTMPLVLVGSYGNTKLLPERSREFESGFYTELWNQRVSLTFDGYHKMRYNAIVTSPLAPSVGTAAGFNTGTSTLGGGDIIAGTTASYAYNVGTVRNSGVSATVGARVLDGRAVSWQMNSIISKNNE